MKKIQYIVVSFFVFFLCIWGCGSSESIDEKLDLIDEGKKQTQTMLQLANVDLEEYKNQQEKSDKDLKAMQEQINKLQEQVEKIINFLTIQLSKEENQKKKNSSKVASAKKQSSDPDEVLEQEENSKKKLKKVKDSSDEDAFDRAFKEEIKEENPDEF